MNADCPVPAPGPFTFESNYFYKLIEGWCLVR